jgi:hypothetical protein
MPDAEVMNELSGWLHRQHFEFDEAQFARDQAWIKRDLAKEMYVFAFNVDESDKVFVKSDPEVRKAIESMPKAEALVENAKHVMARRRQ